MALSLRLPHQNPVHTSPFPNTRYMSGPSHSSRFYHPHGEYHAAGNGKWTLRNITWKKYEYRNLWHLIKFYSVVQRQNNVQSKYNSSITIFIIKIKNNSKHSIFSLSVNLRNHSQYKVTNMEHKVLHLKLHV
jgi:hypothetical protein